MGSGLAKQSRQEEMGVAVGDGVHIREHMTMGDVENNQPQYMMEAALMECTKTCQRRKWFLKGK